MSNPSAPILTTPSQLGAHGADPASGERLSRFDGIRHRLFIGAGADSARIAEHLDTGRNGIVLLGASESRMARTLRRTHPDLPILIDRAAYYRYEATADAPFPLQESPNQLLSPPTLTDVAAAQLAEGATLPVLAMGFLAPGDPEPLRAAMAHLRAAGIREGILLVPADFSWLKKTYRAQFIAILKTSPVPVAIALNNRGNALEDSDCLHGFRLLFEQVPDAIAWRIDHNGLGAMAHGAAAAVIGMLASHRHISVEGEISRTPNDKHPNVWVAQLMRWGKASALRRNFFTTVDAPGCASAPCHGQSPVRFTATESGIADGNMHNVCAFLDEHRQMPTNPDEAKAWWRTRVRTAVDATAAFGVRIQKPKLKPPADVDNWFNELQ